MAAHQMQTHRHVIIRYTINIEIDDCGGYCSPEQLWLNTFVRNYTNVGLKYSTSWQELAQTPGFNNNNGRVRRTFIDQSILFSP